MRPLVSHLLWMTILFLVPIYYQARGKGYNALLLMALAVIAPVPFAFGFAATGSPVLALSMVAVPASILGVLVAAPPRPGATGTQLPFPCPNCHQTIALPRRLWGLVALCPECKETLTVPKTVEPQEPLLPEHERPKVLEGQVIFATCATAADAECLARVLVDNDVPAMTLGENSSGVLVPVISPSSHVVIDASDWERAVEIERSWIEATARR